MKKKLGLLFALVLVVSLMMVPAASVASPSGPWWDVEPENEISSPYYDSILYSEIAPLLREIEVNSNRVQVEVIGQSAAGRNLFLVTISSPKAMGRLGKYQAISQTMLKDPEKAQEMIEKFGDFKVPFFVNASIHGREYPGTDAVIRLIETLAYEDTEEVQAILDNVILLINVCANPDGRVGYGGKGFNLNRDFITQCQPETRATVSVWTEWNPMVLLDLHGFGTPMYIEPCTPPHPPNVEYDLQLKWAFPQALAMEAELFAQTGYPAHIPIRDRALGWDDWPPIYSVGLAMYHGTYVFTTEAPYRDERGVNANFAAMWGALKFVAENREGMVRDQIEVFKRGFLAEPQQLIPQELLDMTEHDQYNEYTIMDFPAAYVIPADAPLQLSSHQPAKLVDFLLFNDVQVEQASQAFTLDEVDYPKGTYIVWMDQPKRGLANVILEDGWDLSSLAELSFHSPPSVWSLPLLWGVSQAVMEEKMDIATHPVNKADAPRGSKEGGNAGAYAYLPTSIAAFKATNDLLARGVTLYRAPDPFETFGAGAIIVPAEPTLVNELANQYGLAVFALLDGRPESAVLVTEQRIAVYGDEGVRYSLDELGFDYDMVSASDLNEDAILEYDVFVNQSLRWSDLSPAGRESVMDWFEAGGDYVGLCSRGRAVDFAVDAGFVDVDYGYSSGNAIVNVDYDPNDSVAAGFREDGYAFVYRSVWFTEWADMEVSASLDDSDDFLVAGFWPDWKTSGAKGMPVILHADDVNPGKADVTLIGIDATFRGHPRNTFRILANAIYNGLD